MHLSQCSQVKRVSLAGNGVCQHRGNICHKCALFPLQTQGLGEMAELHWGNSQLNPPSTRSTSGWSGNLTGICATLPVHRATAGHHIPTAQPWAGEGNSCQSWPSVPTAGLTVLLFPPAPENIITKQSYTTSDWNQK